MTITVITGCSTGIGYATALRLAQDGHRVVATMRNPDACDLATVAKEKGLDLETKSLDVNHDTSVNEATDRGEQPRGPGSDHKRLEIFGSSVI